MANIEQQKQPEVTQEQASKVGDLFRKTAENPNCPYEVVVSVAQAANALINTYQGIPTKFQQQTEK